MTIYLLTVDPRWRITEVEHVLARNGYGAASDLIHAAHPRDLQEVYKYLPDDVTINLWEVPDATHNQT
jgi:hypothetical protein